MSALRARKLVAVSELLFDQTLVRFKAVLDSCDVTLFLLEEWLGADDSTIAATKDVQLAVAEGHIEDDSICILASLTSSSQTC